MTIEEMGHWQVKCYCCYLDNSPSHTAAGKYVWISLIYIFDSNLIEITEKNLKWKVYLDKNICSVDV